MWLPVRTKDLLWAMIRYDRGFQLLVVICVGVMVGVGWVIWRFIAGLPV